MRLEPGRKRWRAVVHLRMNEGAHCMELWIDQIGEIDAAVGMSMEQVISVHVVPAQSHPGMPHQRVLN